MIKTVKLNPMKAITGLHGATITSRVDKIMLSVEEIRICICNKCIVDEYLKDNSLLRLDLSNYMLDNNNEDNDEDTPTTPAADLESVNEPEPVVEVAEAAPVEEVKVEEVVASEQSEVVEAAPVEEVVETVEETKVEEVVVETKVETAAPTNNNNSRKNKGR